MNFSKRNISLAAAGILILLAFGAYFFLCSPPTDFPPESIVTIAEGTIASDASAELASAHIIKYPALLEILLRISGTQSGVQAGVYRFSAPENLFIIAHRLVTGAYGFPPVRLTFVEGTTVREMGTKIADAFPGISATDFRDTGKQYEGYLFPDTYLFSPSTDITSILKTMRENFNAKLSSFSADISASGRPISDIVIMASLIEKEARTDVNRRIVAGILWDRLALGMPLQVDAVFGYIFNRDTYSPSLEDLTADSPYNTYTHKGLPPGPIDNPGLNALQAALRPTKTNYLYYLSGSDNLMHYAATYAEHQINRQRYLK